MESSACCPVVSWGKPSSENKDGAKFTGNLLVIGACKAPIYYSAPPQKESNKAILIFPDVWGFSDRLKTIADSFANQSYHVICLDSFRGETKENNPALVPWLQKYPFETVVKPDIETCLEFLLSKNVTRSNVGALGFCWGAWAIAKAAPYNYFKCGVAPHPSMKIERAVFKCSVEDMMDKVKIPLLLLPAGNDEDNLKPGSNIVNKLEVYGGKSVCFPTMIHGWTTRLDMDDFTVKECADRALTMSLEFFNSNL